jgi:hypothetical protein
MTPIERLALIANETYQAFGQTGDLRVRAIAPNCMLAMAKAILTELRAMASDPGIMEAGGLAHYRHGNTQMPRGAIAVGIFTAMIDRILNEGGGVG